MAPIRHLWRSRNLPALVWALLIGGFLFGFGAIMTLIARLFLGDRGNLMPLLLEWLLPLIICAPLVVVSIRGVARGVRILAVFAVPLAALGLFAGWHALLVVADMTLPFDERDEIVVASHYRYGARSHGEWHLLTAEGKDYSFPPLVRPRLLPGRYALKVTQLNHLVMESQPIP